MESANATSEPIKIQKAHCDGDFSLHCVMALVRHGDRTCKQKITVKFHGNSPEGFVVNVDIRLPEEIARFGDMLQRDRWYSKCRSELSVFRNGLSVIRSGRGDLKLKIEVLDSVQVDSTVVPGWALKIKWGGNLTDLGKLQAFEAGCRFRSMHIPLTLCSSQLNVKAYASTDLRCKETAGNFMKGLMLESGETTPIEVPIRCEDGPDGLGSLDDTPFRHSPLVGQLRDAIAHILMSGRGIDNDFFEDLFGTGSGRRSSGELALADLLNVYHYKSFSAAVLRLKMLIDDFVGVLRGITNVSGEDSASSQLVFAQSESVGLLYSRWHALAKNFEKSAENKHDEHRYRSFSGATLSSLQISLIGEIFDNARYDFRHNISCLRTLSSEGADYLNQIWVLATLLSTVVGACEYGLTLDEKSFIGATFLKPLVKKLRFDFRVCANVPLGDESIHLEKHGEDTKRLPALPVGRFYFAHHSHMISLINVLKGITLASSEKKAVSPGIIHSPNEKFLSQLDHLGYVSEIIIAIKQNTISGEWKLEISVCVGDDVHLDGSSTAEDIACTTTVLEMIVPSKELIDDFFFQILVIADSPPPKSSLLCSDDLASDMFVGREPSSTAETPAHEKAA